MLKVQRRTYSCNKGQFIIRGVEYKTQDNNGTPVVMSHAFLMNQKIMKKYAVELAKQGYVVYTYDFCGGAIFGKSDGKFCDMTIDTEKEDLLCVINYVKTLQYVDICKLILFGASQGGFISCLIAAELKDEVKQLILIYPALCIPEDAKKGKMQLMEFDPENIEKTFKSKIFKFSPKYPESVIGIDVYEEIKKISCPIFIVHGDKDRIVDLQYAKSALKLSQNEASDLKIIEGAGHGFNKKQFNSAMKHITDYLNRQNHYRSLVRHGIRLKIGKKVKNAALTHFGGQPNVPQDFRWPRFETDSFDDPSGEVKSRPLAFLAQFNCEELAEYDKENLLPHTGMLAFFYSVESNRWGFNPEDKGCSRVYWFENTAALAPARFPDDLADNYRFPALKISMESKDSYPDYDDLPEGVDSDEYEEFFEELNMDEEESVSQILGWPGNIQNAMAEECELIARGLYLGGGRGEIPQEAREEAERTANENWRLLFQLDTVEDGDFELMFGDSGRIYFWIKKEDLAARRFDKVWLILQCY